MTKVGFWFLLFALVLMLAAANTGNNGLYLVLAMMGATLVVAQRLAAVNVRRLAIRLEPPAEVFVNQPAYLRVEVASRGRWLPRWLLVLGLVPAAGRSRRRAAPILIAQLPRAGRLSGELELLARRRGRWRLDRIEVSSLFPLGLFHKAMRYPVSLEMLVYPEVFAPSATQPMRTGRSGDEVARRRGWGHELLALRRFRPGDDPRAIHWKQTARTGRMIVSERATEESRRLSVVFDNAVGTLADRAARKRFEQLVSEAATAAVDALASGFEVELLTREVHLPFAGGWRQRRQILEALALVEPRPEAAEALQPPAPESPHLLLAMDGKAPPRRRATA